MVAALLMVAALAHSLDFFPFLLLPVLVVLMLRADHPPRRAVLMIVSVWAVAQILLLTPLTAPAWTYRIDLRVLDLESVRFRQDWSPLTRVLSGLVLMAAIPLVGRMSLAARRTTFLALLGAATVVTLWSFDRGLLTEFSQVKPAGYGHDHFLYQENWRQMKLGQGYYSAASQAFRSDLRGQGATVRPPLMFYIWKLLPMPPLTLYVAFTLVTLTAILGAYLLARRLGAGQPSLTAAALVVGQYFYAAYSAGYLFLEYWVLPLAFFSLLSLLSDRPRLALLLALLGALIREFMAVYMFGLSVALLWQGGRSQGLRVGLAWLSWAAYYAFHLPASRWVLAQNLTTMPDLWKTFGHGGVQNLWACAEVGSLMLPHRDWTVGVVLVIGLAGLSRLSSTARVVFGLGVLPYVALFAILGHEPVLIAGRPFYATETWGAYFMLWWPVLVALALSPTSPSMPVDASA